MLKKTITYTDFFDVEHTEDFYFNLSKTELIELQGSREGGYENYLTKIAESENPSQILTAFRAIIKLAYGERSEDGKRFIKSDELSEGFLQSAAFESLIDSFFENADAAADFANGLLPADLVEKAQQQNQKPGVPQDYKKKQ